MKAHRLDSYRLKWFFLRSQTARKDAFRLPCVVTCHQVLVSAAPARTLRALGVD
jgi:hypothetical protein